MSDREEHLKLHRLSAFVYGDAAEVVAVVETGLYDVYSRAGGVRGIRVAKAAPYEVLSPYLGQLAFSKLIASCQALRGLASIRGLEPELDLQALAWERVRGIAEGLLGGRGAIGRLF